MCLFCFSSKPSLHWQPPRLLTPSLTPTHAPAVSVESTGALSPAVIFRRALAIFKEKCAMVRAELDKLRGEGMRLSQDSESDGTQSDSDDDVDM